MRVRPHPAKRPAMKTLKGEYWPESVHIFEPIADIMKDSELVQLDMKRAWK